MLIVDVIKRFVLGTLNPPRVSLTLPPPLPLDLVTASLRRLQKCQREERYFVPRETTSFRFPLFLSLFLPLCLYLSVSLFLCNFHRRLSILFAAERRREFPSRLSLADSPQNNIGARKSGGREEKRPRHRMPGESKFTRLWFIRVAHTRHTHTHTYNTRLSLSISKSSHQHTCVTRSLPAVRLSYGRTSYEVLIGFS